MREKANDTAIETERDRDKEIELTQLILLILYDNL